MKIFQIKRCKLLLFMLIIALSSFTSGDKPAYQFFLKNGKKVGYNKVVKELSKADLIFFGELHNNAICHWLEYEILEDLWSLDSTALVVGAEMFETDQQLIIDEYISGKIRDRDFEQGTRLWNNYKTDYKPLLLFAVDKKIPFVATNIPRRYAAMVNNGGFEALESLLPDAAHLLPPIPFPYDAELKGYKEMMTFGQNMMAHSHVNLPKAQASKDATMAWFIFKNLKNEGRFLHFNGSYHSDNHEGIVWYINKYAPGLKILTISTVEQENLQQLDSAHINKADFILAVDKKVTKTY